MSLDKPGEGPYQAEAVGSWWVVDMSQLCYSRSGYHRGWALGLGIPLTLFFCVGLPAGVFLFMWFSRKQGKLQDMQFQKHYGFMYRLWRDERCWWESVVLLQTCALVMVSTFGFALGPFYQTMVSAAAGSAGMDCYCTAGSAAFRVSCSWQGGCDQCVRAVLYCICMLVLPAIQQCRPRQRIQQHHGCCDHCCQCRVPAVCRLAAGAICELGCCQGLVECWVL